MSNGALLTTLMNGPLGRAVAAVGVHEHAMSVPGKGGKARGRGRVKGGARKGHW